MITKIKHDTLKMKILPRSENSKSFPSFLVFCLLMVEDTNQLGKASTSIDFSSRNPLQIQVFFPLFSPKMLSHGTYIFFNLINVKRKLTNEQKLCLIERLTLEGHNDEVAISSSDNLSLLFYFFHKHVLPP